MDGKTKQAIADNIFHAARPAIRDWEAFPWHLDSKGECDTWKRHSSQALAIDLFGTLRAAADKTRNLILNRFASHIGAPTGGSWSVEPEWLDRKNRLREKEGLRLMHMFGVPGPPSL